MSDSPIKAWVGASMAMAALLILALVAAWLFQDSLLLSRIPPATEAVPTPEPDVALGEELPLYQSAFTAWAALVLLTPAYAFVWTRRRGAAEMRRWLAWWTVAWVAYVVHLGISMFLFFQGDFAWMTSSSRVSAFWPGMVIAVWWPLDCWLARRPDVGWVTVQRVAIHLLVFVLFVGGSAVKGELWFAQMLGWAFVAATLFTGAAALWRGRRA